jgi:hypothetical protein
VGVHTLNLDHNRTLVCRTYLQHVEAIADDMEAQHKELWLYAKTRVGGAAR